MGFLRWIATKIVSYFLAGVATISILYLSTYGIFQNMVVADCEHPNIQMIQPLSGMDLGMHGELAISSSSQSACLTQFGFNEPLPIRFGLQMYRLVTFNFGNSYFVLWKGSHNVATIIARYLPNTILLFTTATLLLIAVGVLSGLSAARFAGGLWDRFLPILALISWSFPAWWIGMMLIAGLGYGLKILPPYGINSVPTPSNPVFYGLDVMRHMILPTLAILIVGFGGFAYVTRSLLTSTMEEDFVLTARARGLSESRVIFRHVFRTASPAIVTQAILVVAMSIAGAMVTEIVFIWPGIGLLTYIAIEQSDLPVIIGVTFVLALILYIGLFMGDLIYGMLDPRIRAGTT